MDAWKVCQFLSTDKVTRASRRDYVPNPVFCRDVNIGNKIANFALDTSLKRPSRFGAEFLCTSGRGIDRELQQIG